MPPRDQLLPSIAANSAVNVRNTSLAGKFLKQIYFPNYAIFPIHVPKGKEVTEVQFRCPANKTKFEIKEYLQSIYGLQVEQVRTSVVPARRIRYKVIPGSWSTPVWKKAWVKLAEPFTRDE